jgi:hypothetical protein
MRMPTKSMPSKECQRTMESSPFLRKIPHYAAGLTHGAPTWIGVFTRDRLARLLIKLWA